MKEKIQKAAEDCFNEIVEMRRHLHAHPELAFEEHKTAEYISSKLNEYKIPHKKGIAKTGIVALIEGKNPSSKIVALRADMDALPIQEENNISYKSQTSGVMHACGHDVHMACLLGAAKILSSLKEEFEGSVKLIFQPSEEKFPGGASVMIKEGVLKNPDVNVIIGQHVLPTLEAGKIGIKAGMYMASTDEVYLTVRGKGGHAATPELVTDTVLITSSIIVALQQVVSRFANPATPSVLSFGRIIADGRTNIIPDEVKVEGTFRTFDEKWRNEAHIHITEIATKTAESMGGSCEVFIDKGYPFLVNDEILTKEVTAYSQEYLGKEKVDKLELRSTAEDFAYYSQQVPAVFFRLGVKPINSDTISNLHTSTFTVDESSIKIGMGLMAWIAMQCLYNK